MKRYFLEIIFILLLLIGSFLLFKDVTKKTALDTTNTPIILIDAGHGGADPGMIGVDNLEEKKINLEIAIKLKSMLKEKGFYVLMTRDSDKGLYDENSRNKKIQDLQKRIEFMVQYKPSLCISIHQNSYPDDSVKGPQVFFYKDSPEGEKLAGILQKRLNECLEIERPRTEKANTTYYLLKRSPCILNIVECGFLTNPKEAELLQKEEYQEKIAAAITDGICIYMGG